MGTWAERRTAEMDRGSGDTSAMASAMERCKTIKKKEVHGIDGTW